jgi:large subunit ribosomal protein L3
MRALLAEKLEMTHIFDETGNFVPVTILLATPSVVTQVKTQKVDGYEAIQIGFGNKKNHKKPQIGHLAKADIMAKKLTEIEIEANKEYKIGDKIDLSIFDEGEKIILQGLSKGKGFAGTIKRHNFHRGPKTHGSHNYRAPGSIGAGFPQHVFKGQKLPGRMGAALTTVKNNRIARLMPEENLILIRGAVPGPKKGIVLVYSLSDQRQGNSKQGAE